ncbi:MAG: RNA polymerase sigma factor [Fibrobacteria bacterium]
MKSRNPFNSTSYSDQEDLDWIRKTLDGDKHGLESLIQAHQGYIYNLAMKMTNNVADAQDVTQEILIKIISNLSKYDSSKGRFRTWLYRITFNHILNLKKQSYEKLVSGFDEFFDYIEGSAVVELSQAEEGELEQEIKESTIACMSGMIMCLDREQRLTFIVGAVFEIDHNLAADIFAIRPENFRKRLSRARADLYHWMSSKCGLVNTANACRCPKKTKGFIANGWVTPGNLKWNSDYQYRISELLEAKVDTVLLARDDIYTKLFQEHPFKESTRSGDVLKEILSNRTLSEVFDLDG